MALCQENDADESRRQVLRAVELYAITGQDVFHFPLGPVTLHGWKLWISLYTLRQALS